MKTRFKLAGVAALMGLAGIRSYGAEVEEKAGTRTSDTKPMLKLEVQPKPPTPPNRPTELQDLIRYFREQRAEFLLTRQQLREQLAAAESEAQRRASCTSSWSRIASACGSRLTSAANCAGSRWRFGGTGGMAFRTIEPPSTAAYAFSL